MCGGFNAIEIGKVKLSNGEQVLTQGVIGGGVDVFNRVMNLGIEKQEEE